MPAPKRAEPPARIHINYPAPTVDGGKYPAKRCVGDTVTVTADVFRDGHEMLRAAVRYKAPGAKRWLEAPMHQVDAHINGVLWEAEFTVETPGSWEWTIEAWTDRFATWRDELQRKHAAGQDDLAGELSEGVVLLEDAASRAESGEDRATIERSLDALKAGAGPEAALAPDLFDAVSRVGERYGATRLEKAIPLEVDRVRARFSSWYELFPRSFGGLKAVEELIPDIADLGFDVLYFPPVHPIGRKNRKGRNNTLVAGPDDPGSPYAIGAAEGGHDTVHPELGTMDDLRSLTATAHRHGMDVALDIALNASADHPWLTEHPEWFLQRPDGTIKYAENPPKKYQDIYPLNFWCADRQNLWNACRDIVLFWIGHGVRIFRVDNPHTKAFAFWEWLIREVQALHPGTIFFSEAFTRPKRMNALAKLGFTMSYTYFTWKNSSWDLRTYFQELAGGPMVEYYRGNLFTNTPDILNEYLVNGGRPAFRIRLLLAATLSPLYGIYSGFELCENVPIQEGSEEYFDSEKYQLRPRNYDGPGNINADIARINRLRRAHPALQRNANLTFHTSENDTILFYRKAAREPVVQWTSDRGFHVPASVIRALGVTQPSQPERGGDLLIAVNTDPHHVQETMVHVPIHEMGIDDEQPYVVHDLLTGARYTWRGVRNFIRLDPAEQPGHVLLVEPPEEIPQPTTVLA
jgi:starch synthase (maltosyl-transferring)